MVSRRSKAPGDRRSRRWKERIAIFVMALFPMLIAGGFMAPGIVRVLALAEQGDASDSPKLRERLTPYDKRPLLLPRDFKPGFIPALPDPDLLYVGSSYRTDLAADHLSRLMAYTSSHTDAIILDDVGKYVYDVVFKDALLPDEIGPEQIVRDDMVTPLCGTLWAGNCVRFDDFVGAAVEVEPVPEPGTAGLVGLGLGLLALAGRRGIHQG